MVPGTRLRFTDPYSGKKFTVFVPKRWKHDCDGFFLEDKKQISIRPGLSEDREREILFHELTHWALTGPVAVPLHGEQGIEEVIVLTVEQRLFRLLRKNTRLTDLLFPRGVL